MGGLPEENTSLDVFGPEPPARSPSAGPFHPWQASSAKTKFCVEPTQANWIYWAFFGLLRPVFLTSFYMFSAWVS